jgi:hypothetical protein
VTNAKSILEEKNVANKIHYFHLVILVKLIQEVKTAVNLIIYSLHAINA